MGNPVTTVRYAAERNTAMNLEQRIQMLNESVRRLRRAMHWPEWVREESWWWPYLQRETRLALKHAFRAWWLARRRRM